MVMTLRVATQEPAGHRPRTRVGHAVSSPWRRQCAAHDGRGATELSSGCPARARGGARRTLDTMIDRPPVYLDHAATTPMVGVAIEAMTARLGTVGNASS